MGRQVYGQSIEGRVDKETSEISFLIATIFSREIRGMGSQLRVRMGGEKRMEA